MESLEQGAGGTGGNGSNAGAANGGSGAVSGGSGAAGGACEAAAAGRGAAAAKEEEQQQRGGSWLEGGWQSCWGGAAGAELLGKYAAQVTPAALAPTRPCGVRQQPRPCIVRRRLLLLFDLGRVELDEEGLGVVLFLFIYSQHAPLFFELPLQPQQRVVVH